MSYCRPDGKNLSCIACCGIFNLDLEKEKKQNLLVERTQEFQSSVDYSIRYTISEFRKSRELFEENLPKKDVTTYNCPFLGFPEKNLEKPGCMIHPVYSGDPSSQNFSFYGASICRGYFCPVHEWEHQEEWSKWIYEFSKDYYSYSLLLSNFRVFQTAETFISRNYLRKKLDLEELRSKIFIFFGKLLENQEFTNSTSFESMLMEKQSHWVDTALREIFSIRA